jgi:hypothetical protein
MGLPVLFALPLFVPQVECLGARDFRTREAAHRSLAVAGDLAEAALLRGAAHPDPEVRARSWQLLGRLEQTPPRRVARLCRAGCLPWLALDNGYWGSAHRWRALAEPEVDDPPLWTAWREATRLWLRSRAEAGDDPAELLRRLDGMAAEEARWKAR